MEEFKSLEELTSMDEKHAMMGAGCGAFPSLEGMHKYLSNETLNDSVPDEIKGQFNVAKNMALYSYFFYALAPEVHLKTFTVIEHALGLKAGTRYNKKPVMLGELMRKAVKNKWISDAGFRHLENPSPENVWCEKMIKIIPKSRNNKAHGSTLLVDDCLLDISICADFINQLFPGDLPDAELPAPESV